MQKEIFLFSDEVLEWNFFNDGNKKDVYCDFWGTESIKRILEFVREYFSNPTRDIDWHISGLSNDRINLEAVNPCNKNYNQAFANWKKYKEGNGKAWRIDNISYLGQAEINPDTNLLQDNLELADLVIVQDYGLNIRNINVTQFSNSLKNKWTIYIPNPPLFKSQLWTDLLPSFGKQTILLLQVEDIRKLNTSISKGLSWEQTVQDIVNEIYFHASIDLYPLRTAEYVIISFGCTGALLIHNSDKSGKPEFYFFFDSMGGEGYWEEAHPGYLPGDFELLTSLVCKEVLFPVSEGKVNFSNAIRGYLPGRRKLLQIGGKAMDFCLELSSLTEVFDEVYGSKPSHEFSPVKLDFDMFVNLFKEDSENPQKNWTLLGLTQWDYYSLSRQIALTGPKTALKGWNIPIAQYNFLLTVDRKEMEFLHHLKTLISEYMHQRNNQPLSIAVFGSPGSGKSFSIKQLAKALDVGDQEIKEVTFNLSQFNENNPQDLYQAFHVVRDISLSGKVPLVFWDEFDSKNLAWLRYFLAPMQDGEFQEGQLTHNIGKSIFVFAGGTSTCMEQFEEKTQKAISEKGPDFLSRIKGYINVLGPNPVLPYSFQKLYEKETDTEGDLLNHARQMDPEYIIRRALLINSLLSVGYRHLIKDGILQIDDGVLNALLMVPQFKHGTRSLETIFKTSQLFDKSKFHRSDLPPVDQMNLHVNGQQFYKLIAEEKKYYQGGEAFYHLVNEIAFDEENVSKMAVGVHTMYSLIFSIDKSRDPFTISRDEFLAAYQQNNKLPGSLPPDEVSQNYHSARKIPEKLAAVGFAIEPLSSETPAAEFSSQELETISQLEHIRWVRHHIEAGWTYNKYKQKSIKKHDGLVAWDEKERSSAGIVYGEMYVGSMGLSPAVFLSEQYKDLDRLISKAIPWMLEIVGYKMVRVKDNLV